ncbi:MAG TPA: glycosyltransferase family 1 protein [Bryobacteraceae bacterium]
MKVLIDATPLLVRSAGVKNYLYYWIEHLRRGAGGDAIATWPALENRRLDHEASMASRWRTAAGLGMLAASNYTPLPVLDWAARGTDVFHATSLVRRPPQKPRLTSTIHDMTCWLMPELHPAANRRADASFAEVLRCADSLIAVSQNTKDDAVRVLALDPEKITVIHSGVADAFFDAKAGDIRERYGLDRPFVLFLGTIEPRKNLDTLLSAYEAVPRDVRDEFELVVAGPSGWASGETKARLGAVRRLGYVPEEDVAPLTAAATVFAYPSLYEGFGFPVAQAMAAGTPVVTSNLSSLPEIAGDAAELVDPRSVTELRDALARLLISTDRRALLAARGRERARAFRWEECAAQSMRFFRGVAGR